VIDTFAGQAYVIIIRWTYAKIRELLVLQLPIDSPNRHLPYFKEGTVWRSPSRRGGRGWGKGEIVRKS